jgi:hypothetical protein
MDYIDDLVATVRLAAERLKTVPDPDAARRPAPGKWSAKEIIGHLVDSAANNHQRFVRAGDQDDLVFPRYDQDTWVSLQQYQEAPWQELLGLWAGYNLHLARVMQACPDAIRLRSHARHNLDQIAWQPVPRSEPASLDYLMRDYVGHLHHHLRQIEALRLAGVASIRA